MAKHTSLERDPVMGPHPPHPHDTEAHTENDLHLRHLGTIIGTHIMSVITMSGTVTTAETGERRTVIMLVQIVIVMRDTGRIVIVNMNALLQDKITTGDILQPHLPGMKHETDTTLLVLPHQGTKDPQRDQAGVPVHQREGVTKKVFNASEIGFIKNGSITNKKS